MEMPADARQIDETISVSGQITPDNVAAIAATGFTMIICNRPDNEAPGQPTAEQVAQAARQHGLEFRHIPVYPTGITPDAVADTATALAEATGPVFAYCRSGARSTNVYMLSQR